MLSLALSVNAAVPPQVITMAIQSEPPNLNSIKALDMGSYLVIGHTQEGLTTTDKDGNLAPGVAKSWEIKDKTAVFHLRKDAKWSDGVPVKAKDFVFAWRQVADPKVASEYAFILFPIKNAKDIVAGKLPPESLGVSAPDDWTVKVELERPCPFFAGLVAAGVFSPIREDFYKAQGDRYAAEVANLIANGPFKLTKWVHGASLTMEKNPAYWNAANVKIDRIEVPYITPDSRATFDFFRAGKIDFMAMLGRDQLPLAQKERYKVQPFFEGRVMYLEFNLRKERPTSNLNLRKAIRAIYRGDEFVNRVISIPGTRAAVSLVPSTMKGYKGKFVKEHPVKPVAYGLQEAKKHLELAKKEMGGTIPPIRWLTSDTEVNAREAEYFQGILKSQLGIDLLIDKQIPKQRFAKMTAGDFDIASTGWGADYDDPMTFADLNASWNDANRGLYNNPQFDRLIRAAQDSGDQKFRMKAMADAVQLALDDVAVIPLYERVQAYLISDRIQGLVRNTVGLDPDFRYARVAAGK